MTVKVANKHAARWTCLCCNVLVDEVIPSRSPLYGVCVCVTTSEVRVHDPTRVGTTNLKLKDGETTEQRTQKPQVLGWAMVLIQTERELTHHLT